MSGEQPTEVKIGYLELSDSERKQVTLDREAVKSVLVSGFRDEIAAEIKSARERWENETDPSTRPGFTQPDPVHLEVDIKSFGAVRRAVVSKATGQTVGWAPGGTAKVHPDQALGATEGGWLPPVQMSPGDRAEMARDFAGFVGDLSRKGTSDGINFAVLKFPRGDIENFSVCRWAMAVERAQNTVEGTQSYAKHAPWETAYYAALERYALSKSQGDMVSGLIPGRAA